MSMNNHQLSKYLWVSTLAFSCMLLIGCESVSKLTTPQKTAVKNREVKPAQPPVPTAVEPTPLVPIAGGDVQALKDGVSLYNDGDYNGAIKRLSSANEIWNGHNKAIQVEALKTMAFSYCVTSRTQLCRQQFERALKIDPTFDLMLSEIGHPIWGPVFLKAKKAK